MKDVYDMNSGLFYCAMTSQPEAPAKKHSTLGEGLTIVGGFFLCALAVLIAI